MGTLTLITDREGWDQARRRLTSPSVLTDFSMVSAGALLFPGETAVAEAALFEEDGEALFYPYLKRPCPYRAELFDICSAYEFGGFWCSSTNKSVGGKLAQGFEVAFREEALKAGIVSEFVRISPFCGVGGLGWQDYEVKQIGQHILIPTRSKETVWNEMHGSRRTQIRQSEREGLRIEFSQDVETFTKIYHRRLDRLNSYKFYYFPEVYLDRLQEKIILFVYDDKNEICGTQMYIKDNGVLFYFLSADVEEKRQVKPNGFAIYEMVKWACENGINFLHLGGGVETLHHYKSLFSPRRIDYFVARRIVNHAAYDDLVKRHEAARGELHNKGYFPLYRLDTTLPSKPPEERRYTATQTLS